MQREYLAFAWQEVVFDADALHGLQVATEYRRGDRIGDQRNLVPAFFKCVERGQSYLLSDRNLFRIRRVPLRDSRIKIPAVVVNPLVAFQQLCQEFSYPGQVHLLQMN